MKNDFCCDGQQCFCFASDTGKNIENWWTNLYECNKQGRIVKADLGKSKGNVCTGLFHTAKSGGCAGRSERMYCACL